MLTGAIALRCTVPLGAAGREETPLADALWLTGADGLAVEDVVNISLVKRDTPELHPAATPARTIAETRSIRRPFLFRRFTRMVPTRTHPLQTQVY
jgi:hypothetical protein